MISSCPYAIMRYWSLRFAPALMGLVFEQSILVAKARFHYFLDALLQGFMVKSTLDLSVPVDAMFLLREDRREERFVLVNTCLNVHLKPPQHDSNQTPCTCWAISGNTRCSDAQPFIVAARACIF